MDNYSLIYKLDWNNEEKTHIFKGKNDTKSFIKCLHRGIAFIEWEPRAISSFEYFKIWLINYDIDFGGGSYADFENWNTEPSIVSNVPWFRPINENVTNEILDECFFTSENMNMYFDWEFLHVYEEKYYFEKKMKPRELLDLIFTTKEKYNSNIISYTTLKKELEDKDYYKLNEKHINYNWARNILKDRLKLIREELKIGDKIISLTKNNIELTI